MHITITEKLKPFDHNPGTRAVLPNSNWSIEVFPSLICLYDLSVSRPKLIAKIKMNLKGPVKDFTVQLDLEKGCLLVFGEAASGYFRYKVAAAENALFIHSEKGDVAFQQILGEIKLLSEPPKGNVSFERLSLGSHKAQDWTLIKRRQDLKEIFPVWLRIGQSVVYNEDMAKEGTASLLEICHEAIKNRDVNTIAAHFQTLFNVGFQSLMEPDLFDSAHHGLELPPVSEKTSPLMLLSYGSKLIRSCFATVADKTLAILPALPVEFHVGRFVHFHAENIGIVDLEWSKKIIRRMILFAKADETIELKWQKEIKRFRLKEESETKSRIIEASSPIKIEKGKTYFFDRFEK